MKIVEKFIQSKTGDISTCEDGFFISNDYVCVIDGATSKDSSKFQNKTSGQIAKDIIIEKLQDCQKDLSAEKLIGNLTTALANFYKSQNLFDKMHNKPVGRATASLIIYSRHYHEIWFIGDCKAMIDGELIENPKKIDQTLAEIRAFFLETELMNGKSVDELLVNDTGREFIIPLLKKQQKFQNNPINSPYSYGVIDGFPVDQRFIKKVKLEKESRSIVLCSDGYPYVYQSLEKSEKMLEGLLKVDPLCFRQYKTTKGLTQGNVSFDDRTYVRFQL